MVYRFRLQNATVGKIFRDVVLRHPNKPAILWEHGCWTFKQLDDFSNQFANFLQSQGFEKGDEIALFMEGRPEYIGLWLGASKVGVVTAFINTNLKSTSLIHSITVVNSRALIFTPKLSGQVRDIVPDLAKTNPGLKMYYFGGGSKEDELLNNNDNNNKNQLSQLPLMEIDNEFLSSGYSSDFPKEKMLGGFSDKLFYVYTSGTTGLPKAAIIRHARYIFLGAGANNLIGLNDNNTIYTPIPLYHAAGGALGTCQCLIFGNTLAIRDKFSASNFWSDCIKYRCTAAQYIGEICRYLLTQPPSSVDKQHCVRVMFGNGLRRNIWNEFKERFGIGLIAEFYGSTEGNANVVNYTGKEGACGFLSQIVPFFVINLFYPVNIIKVNEETGEPVRDPVSGLCIPCGPGDTGEFVGKIITTDPTRTFDGYASKEATEKKIYRNVFKQGDMAFSSGDLLTVDDLGYVYFKDRTGDTYRWKGENISTTEVETVIGTFVTLTDIVVYGVNIPSCEGKAGMAAITLPESKVEMDNFYTNVRKTLPPYAIPIFIRLCREIETTGTFKLPKVTLQKEGFNPQAVNDPIFYLDIQTKTYRRLDVSTYEDIMNGQIRF